MKCERFMERYLHLGEGARLPVLMGIHLARCSECSAETAALEAVMAQMRDFSSRPMDRDMSDQVMTLILHNSRSYGRNISLYNWIGAGVTIFASIFLVTLSDSLAWLKFQFGSDLEAPFSIVMGIVITTYAAIFIGTHLDDFQRWIENHK